MNAADRSKQSLYFNSCLEEGHYFKAVAQFGDILTNAYRKGVGSVEWEHLMECLEQQLPADVYENIFRPLTYSLC